MSDPTRPSPDPFGGLDPEVAGQLLRIAADFLDEATIEDDEEHEHRH